MTDIQPYENEYGEQMIPAALVCHNPACGNCDQVVQMYVTEVNPLVTCGGWLIPPDEELAELSPEDLATFRPKSCGEQITDITPLEE